MAEAAKMKVDTFIIYDPTQQSNTDLKVMLNKYTKNPIVSVVASKDSTNKRKVALESSESLADIEKKLENENNPFLVLPDVPVKVCLDDYWCSKIKSLDIQDDIFAQSDMKVTRDAIKRNLIFEGPYSCVSETMNQLETIISERFKQRWVDMQAVRKAEDPRRPSNYQSVNGIKSSLSIDSAFEEILLEEPMWKFIRFKYPDIFETIEEKKDKRYRSAGNEIQIKDSKDGIRKLEDWLTKHDIRNVETGKYDTPSDVERDVFKKLTLHLAGRNPVVLVEFLSDKYFEVTGLKGDIETFKRSLQRDISDHKISAKKMLASGPTSLPVDINRHYSDDGKLSNMHDFKQPNAVSLDDVILLENYKWQYIKFKHPDVYEILERKQDRTYRDQSHKILLKDSKDGISKWNKFLIEKNIDKVEKRSCKYRSGLDMEAFKQLIIALSAQSKLVLVDTISDQDFRVVGIGEEIDDFLDELKRDISNHRKSSKQVMQSGAMSLPISNGNYEAVGGEKLPYMLKSNQLQFTTPGVAIQVSIYQGDLTKQKVEAIVNPANDKLMHLGGAAKAIAEAAGSSLVRECDEFIRRNKSLKTTEVMHTTGGRLPYPIKYVIHASGPMAKYERSMKDCSDKLVQTFINCFQCANDLKLESLCVPAISSGTFGVPLDVVSAASWDALNAFDSFMSSAGTKNKLYLKTIAFVNINIEATECLIKTFMKNLDMEMGRRKESVNGRRKNSTGRIEEHRLDIHFEDDDKTSVTMKQDDLVDSRGRTSNRSRPPIIGDHANVHNTRSSEYVCSVCTKKKSMANLIDKKCGHKCCPGCLNGRCSKCLSGKTTSITSPRAARSTVDEPRQEKKEISPEHSARAQWSPETNDTSRLKRSASARGRKKTSPSPDSSPTSARDDTSLKDVEVKDDLLKKRGVKDFDSSEQVGDRSRQKNKDDETCVICMDKLKDPKKLKCGHSFCTDCIEKSLSYQNKCPSCGQIFGTLTGNQPKDGTMEITNSRSSLPGFSGYGTIQINYYFPSGRQQEDHPNPGKWYSGTTRTAYLPDNPEGREISRLLRKAFEARLVFTIGKSNTTGQDNVVIWNDIHHKTSLSGQYGYPDPEYLTRVRDELAAKGIVSTRDKDSPSRMDASSDVYRKSKDSDTGYNPRQRGSSPAHAFSSLPYTPSNHTGSVASSSNHHSSAHGSSSNHHYSTRGSTSVAAGYQPTTLGSTSLKINSLNSHGASSMNFMSRPYDRSSKW